MATKNQKRAEAQAEALPTTYEVGLAEAGWDRLRENPEMLGFALLPERDQNMMRSFFCAGYLQSLIDIRLGVVS